MDRESSPLNRISAAASAHEGIRAFDPLAFNAAPVNGGRSHDHYDDTSRNGPATATNGLHYGSDSTISHGGAGRRGNSAMDTDGDVDGEATTAAAAPSRSNNRGRPRNLGNTEEIPPVTDETGERVREAFRDFLQR